MVNLLIAEDENLVRMGLQSKIDWQSVGVSVCCVCTNGVEAVEYMTEHEVDIVLTDIRMPDMDGIELAQWIRENRTNTHIVFLTGHSEFSYAKSAVKVGVLDYLQKPVNKAEITRVIGSIAERVVHGRREREEQAHIEQMLTQNMGIIRNSFYLSLLHPSFSQDMVQDYLMFFKLEHLIGGVHRVMIMDMGQGVNALPREENKALLDMLIRTIITPPLHFALFTDEKNRQVLLLTSEDVRDAKDDVALAECIRETANDRGISLTVGLGEACQGAQTIFRSYDEADQALLHGFFCGRGTVISAQKSLPSGGSRMRSRADDDLGSQELRAAFARRDWPSVTIFLRQRQDRMHATQGDDSAVNLQILGLFTDLFGIISEWDLDISMIFERHDMVHILQQRNALEDVYGFLTDKYKKAFDLLHAVDREQQLSIVNAVKTYVNENYASDMTLDDISGAVYLSRSYVSTLFKKETGVTLSHYIMTVRIQQAMRIMIEDPQEKLFSISSRVGYLDEKYFSRIFRRVTGQTPQQYRCGLRQK